MDINKNISLREYLYLLTKRIKDPPQIDCYDEFLIEVWDFFSLRAAAEQYYDKNKHVAYSRSGALPVTWQILEKTWKTDGPPEQPITQIAKQNYNEISSLIHNLRKVLNRVRQKVAIAHVQQIDAHCLRWLTRQPGRSAAEKGGVRQEILGVVRIENYNTLENRVLKDFLQRCIGLTTMYLRHYDTKEYHEHINIKVVARLKNLCISGLSIENFSNIQELRDFPQPNYVLQQDRFYSKIWSAYCDILRQEDVAERLWKQKERIDELYRRCNDSIALNCSPKAKYRTLLWVNPLDGKREVLESPIFENELNFDDVEEPNLPAETVRTIDLTYPWDGRDVLIYPSSHKNARPYIQNPHHPSKEPGEEVALREILRKQDAAKLKDYFRYLYGILGGEKWVVLVPDDWDAQWLEGVKRSHPPSLTRDKMFLLWRSIAATLGRMERDESGAQGSLVIADGYRVPDYNAIEIRFKKEPITGRFLPQRASARLHSIAAPKGTDVRFVFNKSFSEHKYVNELATPDTPRLCIGLLNSLNFSPESANSIYSHSDEILFDGVKRYLREESEGLVSYFDERDALSLVVQNKAEEVEFKTLVEHDECSPGGKQYSGKWTKGGALLAGDKKLSLNLLEGEVSDTAPLKRIEVPLDQKIEKTTDVFFKAEITPGQGLVSLTFKADFLKKPLLLDLTKLPFSQKTKAEIEREIKRHFPPIMPHVEASEDLWVNVRVAVSDYLQYKIIPPADTFAEATSYWHKGRVFDPTRMSPIDRLKRENVFGNDPNHRLPRNMKASKEELFNKLAQSYYQKGAKKEDVLRLIAWSYQFDADCFEPLRESFYKKYVEMHGSLEFVEITFCANNFAHGDKRASKILARALERIGKGAYDLEELRLAYNLMQFHPELFKNVSSDLCEKAMQWLIRDYNNRYPYWKKGPFLWAGGNATKAAGYYVKCMLFLLHRRRFDPGFFKCPETWVPSGHLNEELPLSSPTLSDHEATRKSFINYARGHGTIDGIPVGD